MTIVLVTGSRALARHLRLETWALNVLHLAIASCNDVDWVCTGDAYGPDEWALYVSDQANIPSVSYSAKTGEIVESERPDDPEKSRWITTDRLHAAPFERRPLLRNAAMIQDLARATVPVRCVALIAGWSTTAGTQHTVKLAREWGIEVVEHHAPPELAAAAHSPT